MNTVYGSDLQVRVYIDYVRLTKEGKESFEMQLKELHLLYPIQKQYNGGDRLSVVYIMKDKTVISYL